MRYFINDLRKFINNVQQSDDYYSFSLKTEEKNITLFTDYLQVLQAWVEGLQVCIDKLGTLRERQAHLDEMQLEEKNQREALEQIEEAKRQESEILDARKR